MIDYKKLNLEQYTYEELNELYSYIGKLKSKLYRKEKYGAEYQRKWRLDNKEHCKKVLEEYRSKNKDRLRKYRAEYMRKYRANKKQGS